MTYHSLVLISTRNLLHQFPCLSSSLFKTIYLSFFPFPPFFSPFLFFSPLVCLSLDVRLLPSARARDWRSGEFLLTSEFISHENNNHLVLHSSLRSFPLFLFSPSRSKRREFTIIQDLTKRKNFVMKPRIAGS